MIDERMLGYYPEVIKAIHEIQAIVQAEYPEFELQADSLWGLIDEAYLTTMGEERIKQWERLLDIQVSPDSSIEERRDVIIARIRGNKKLNTETIASIVSALTGGRARSRVENSVLYVEIRLDGDEREHRFENVWRELEKRKPAHLGLNVDKLYASWDNIKVEFLSWQSVLDHFDTWEDVYYYNKINDCTWNDLKRTFKTWRNIKDRFDNWGNAYYYRTDKTYGE